MRCVWHRPISCLPTSLSSLALCVCARARACTHACLIVIPQIFTTHVSMESFFLSTSSISCLLHFSKHESLSLVCTICPPGNFSYLTVHLTPLHLPHRATWNLTDIILTFSSCMKCGILFGLISLTSPLASYSWFIACILMPSHLPNLSHKPFS